jgi:5'-deoxynucleotidase YfbR-like HD superfamily hydrolase
VKLFLSHSSKDKVVVNRIRTDLNSHGYQTWVDDTDIIPSTSIPSSIQEGLAQCKVVILFLSRHSVTSKWVSTEWEITIFRTLSGEGVTLIPLRLDECQIPLFLTHCKYSDFREKDNYENNLSELLNTLNILKMHYQETPIRGHLPISSILEYTKELLDDLEPEFISLPVHKRLMILDTLRKLPRSGKKVRLDKFRPPLKIRSVYDHILSTAYTADCLLPHFKHSLRETDYSTLALCCAYHELNEVVLGDIPTYTSLSSNSRNRARILAEERLRSVNPAKRERIANDFISMFLGDRNRKAMEHVTSLLSDESNNVSVIFKLFDKIDPIIATWRYLHHYRGKLGSTPREFNKKMKDFYENPDPKAYIRAKHIDNSIYDLVANLQDRAKAWNYYVDAGSIFNQRRLFSIPEERVRELIEGIQLFDVALSVPAYPLEAKTFAVNTPSSELGGTSQ